MSHVLSVLRRGEAFFAGILIGLAGITPVFAATLDNQLTPRNLVLLVSLILLGVGIALKVMQRRRVTDGESTDDPDMRWWLNP
jgi:hypothetical protein